MRGCTFCPFVGTFFVQIEHGRRPPKVHQSQGEATVLFPCIDDQVQLLHMQMARSQRRSLHFWHRWAQHKPGRTLGETMNILPADSGCGEIFSFRILE